MDETGGREVSALRVTKELAAGDYAKLSVDQLPNLGRYTLAAALA